MSNEGHDIACQCEACQLWRAEREEREALAQLDEAVARVLHGFYSHRPKYSAKRHSPKAQASARKPRR